VAEGQGRGDRRQEFGFSTYCRSDLALGLSRKRASGLGTFSLIFLTQLRVQLSQFLSYVKHPLLQV